MTIEQLRTFSKKHDVTAEIREHFHDRWERKDPIIVKIHRDGCINEAVAWLESATAKGMRHGQFSRERRIENARRKAEKIGLTLDTLAAETHLSHVLSPAGVQSS